MIRIGGLVRASKSIRQRLQTGLGPDEVDLFRNRVLKLIQDVEEICRTHGVKPGQLPAPTRMAYNFLKELDLDNLPINKEAGDSPDSFRPGSLSIRNLVKIGDSVGDYMWNRIDMLQPGSEQRRHLAENIAGNVAMVEKMCADRGLIPASMEEPSRQVYCWLKFLSIGDNLNLHLETLKRAREAVMRVGSKQPVLVQLTCMNAIWRYRTYRNTLLVKINQAFIGADEGVIEAIIAIAVSGRSPEYDRRIREYIESDDYGEMIDELESFAAPPPAPARGRAHHLDESFDRVNAAYFNGAIDKPKLAWNRTLTLRKFGHYLPSRDTVMISVSLDDPAVPDFVVDFVIYHELLHKMLGAEMVNGRRQVHGPAFRAEERRFLRFAEASEFIKRLALRHRTS